MVCGPCCGLVEVENGLLKWFRRRECPAEPCFSVLTFGNAGRLAGRPLHNHYIANLAWKAHGFPNDEALEDRCAWWSKRHRPLTLTEGDRLQIAVKQARDYAGDIASCFAPGEVPCDLPAWGAEVVEAWLREVGLSRDSGSRQRLFAILSNCFPEMRSCRQLKQVSE